MTETVPAVYERLDERFSAVRGDGRLERLWTGGRWTEGPLYVPAGRYLLFSDIPNDRVLRWDEADGSVSVLESPARYPNGRTIDRQGRVVTCRQGARRVERTEHDGSTTVLADRWDGRRLNSPNDVVVSADGAVWFTDPPYGITTDYEGERAEPEIDGCHVYRVDPATGDVTAVATDLERPNGLALSVDGTLLYVADTHRRHLRVFAVDGGRLAGGRCSPSSTAARTACASTRRAASGWRPARPCTCSTPTARSWGGSTCPRRSRTSRSAAASATASSSPRPRRCTRSCSP